MDRCMDSFSRVDQYILDNHDRFVADLIDCLAFPSISADSTYKSGIDECAKFLLNKIKKMGFHTELWETPGNPVLYATWQEDPSLPTVLIYGHYDVQPVDPIDQWVSGPFSPMIANGYLISRGVSDDKGQVYCHLNALESWITVTGHLPVNVILLIEGEEEIGSPNLSAVLAAHRDKISADVLVVSDTPMMGVDTPSISISLRGLALFDLVIKTGASDLHSGQLGGIAPNALHVAASIVTQLQDGNGKVLIPGFYDNVRPLPNSLAAEFATLPDLAPGYVADLGVPLIGPDHVPVWERLWFQPTMDVNGVIGGYTGPGTKTVIPNEATVKLSFRLVPDQTPDMIENQLRTYLKSIDPHATLSITPYPGAYPVRTDPTHWAVTAARAAVEMYFGGPVALQGDGGSIPVVATLISEFSLPAVLMGFNLPNDNIHAPNERFLISRYIAGTRTAAKFLERVRTN